MPVNPLDPATPPQGLSHEQKMWRWRILCSTYFAYAGYYLSRKVFTICKTAIAEDFGWELGATAHIWTAYLVAYMLGQFANSYIGRRWGPRVLLLGGLGISIACNIVFGFADSFATFIVFMFFNGLVQASGWPGSVGGVAQWLRVQERGTIMGVWSTNYLVGNILVKSLGGYLLGAAGWRWSFFGCTLLSFAIWWLIYFWQRNRPEDVNVEPIIDAETTGTRTVQASQEDRITFAQYRKIAFSPVILAMGTSYFCLKFLRYALDSWLPAFLNIQGLDRARAAYYSTIFDWAGFAGVLVAGVALDRLFKGNWALLCFVMGLGMIGGYVAVMVFGTNPIALSVCFGLVGFMLYGPDTVLNGAAAVQVAGEKNGVAVAGLINGIGSIGPIVQEQVIGLMMRGDLQAGMRNANVMALAMSIAFACLMLVVIWRVSIARRAAMKEGPP